jgi:hypothetical protein
MNLRALARGGTAVCIFAALVPIAADAGPPSGQSWVANGSSACERFLTPDILAAILIKPDGAATTIDANSCHSGSVYISLTVNSVDIFKLELPRIVGVNMLAGVGDLAYWNHAGATSAVKGHDRACDISVLNAPYVAKVHDEALGKKLGEICNKLFALP